MSSFGSLFEALDGFLPYNRIEPVLQVEVAEFLTFFIPFSLGQSIVPDGPLSTM